MARTFFLRVFYLLILVRKLSKNSKKITRKKDWHQGYDRFQKSLSGAFRANKALDEPEAIEAKLAHAEFVEREIIALYQLGIFIFELTIVNP